MAEKLLPENPDPSRIVVIYKPLTSREGGMRWLAASKATTFTWPRPCPPSQGTRGSRSQAGPGGCSDQGPQIRQLRLPNPEKVVPKSSTKPKAAVPRRPHCINKGNFGRKTPRALLNTTHSVRMKEKELKQQFKPRLVHHDSLPRVCVTFRSAST